MRELRSKKSRAVNTSDSDLESYRGCDICLQYHESNHCPLITTDLRVLDTPILPKAIASLPTMLEARLEENNPYGIFAKECIQAETRFGPLEAPKYKTLVGSSSSYILKVHEENGAFAYLDITDRSECNWMSLVKFTENESESNCICYEFERKIYFTTILVVESGMELRVTYAPGYRRFLTKIDAESISCSKNLEDSRPEPDLENDESAPVKTRQRKRKLVLEKDSSHKKIKLLRSRNSLNERVTNPFSSEEDNLETPSNSQEDSEEVPLNSQPRKLDSERRNMLKRLGPCLALDEWNCKFCKMVLTDASLFSSHLIRHYKVVGSARTEKSSLDQSDPEFVPTTPYTCDICANKKTFNKAEYVIRHLKKHVNWFDCEFCGKIIQGESHNCQRRVNLKTSSTPYQCGHCDRSFNSASKLASHYNVKHSRNECQEAEAKKILADSFPCPDCSKRFPNKKARLAHICEFTKEESTLHLLINPEINVRTEDFCCGICESEKFPTLTLLETHLRSHGDRIICSICSKALNHKKLKKHVQICQVLNDYSAGKISTLNCPFCDVNAKDDEDFRTHIGYHTHPIMCPGCQIRLSSRDELKCHQCEDLPCDACVEVFDSFLDLRHHIKNIHDNKVDFYCFECAFPFITEKGFNNHSRCKLFNEEERLPPPLSKSYEIKPTQVENETQRPLRKRTRRHQDGEFVCEICGVHYTKFSSLKTHRYTHGPKKHECDICGKSFHRKELLADHKFVHLPPQFPCTTCDQMFKTKKALNVHSRIHLDLKPFRCDYEGCAKAFGQKINLRTHRMTHVPLEEKGIQCPYCPKRLSSKESCNVHIKIHEEERELHKCEHCGKEFNRPHHLLRHKRTMHESQRYVCEFCNAYFKNSHGFTRHLEGKHGDAYETWSVSGYQEARLETPGDVIFFNVSQLGEITTASIVETISDETGVEKDEQQIKNSEVDAVVELVAATDGQEDLANIGIPSTGDGDNRSRLVILEISQDGDYVLGITSGEEVVEFQESET